MLTGTEGKRGRDRNQMRPDERKNKLKIYWRQQKMQETRSEWQGGVGHIQRHFCVHIGLMSLCYKSCFFFCFTAQESLIGLCCFIKIYMFWTYVDILQMILWYKNMNIYNHQPPSYNTPTPRPHIKKEERKVKAFNKIERHTIFLHNITARTAVQLSIHSKQSLPK